MASRQAESSVFEGGATQVEVYTAPIFKSPGCDDAISILLGDWISAKLQAWARGVAACKKYSKYIKESSPVREVASIEDVILEEHFQSIVGSRHMRQWFKLRKAYAMMEEP